MKPTMTLPTIAASVGFPGGGRPKGNAAAPAVPRCNMPRARIVRPLPRIWLFREAGLL